jgi:hypothetical protein
MTFTVSECIKWLKFPKYHPRTGKNMSNYPETVYKELCITCINKLEPLEIYEYNIDIYNLLGLNKLYEITEEVIDQDKAKELIAESNELDESESEYEDLLETI